MKFKAEISIFSLLFWVALCVSIYLFLPYPQWPTWSIMAFPSIFTGRTLGSLTIKYNINDSSIRINQIFKKQIEIKFEKIRNCKKKKSSFLKQLFIGAPKHTIEINYNKYDTIEIMTFNQEIFDRIQLTIGN